MQQRWLFLISISILSLLLLSACGGSVPQMATNIPQTTQEPDQAAQVTPTTPPTRAAPSSTPEAQEEAPLEIPADQPAVRAGLSASNPSEIELASGQLQLVEFFAFW